MFKKLFITFAALGVLSSSAFAWSETFDSSSSGSPYNAFQFIVQNGVTVSFGSSATAAGWQVVSTQAWGGSYTVINAMGPTEGDVDNVRFSGPGSENGAHLLFQKWYITPTTQELKRNYYMDKNYDWGDYSISGNNGWYMTILSNRDYDDWYGPNSKPTTSSSVQDGGLTLVLLGLALFSLLLFNRVSSRSH